MKSASVVHDRLQHLFPFLLFFLSSHFPVRCSVADVDAGFFERRFIFRTAATAAVAVALKLCRREISAGLFSPDLDLEKSTAAAAAAVADVALLGGLFSIV